MSLFFFAVSALLILLGLGACVAGSASRHKEPISAGVLLLIVGSLLLFFNSFTTVAARGVAVQTAFGKVQGAPLKAGWHWVAPWNDIEEFDASVKTLKFYQGEKDRPADGDDSDPGDDGNCITVRLANNNTACVDVTSQWNINPDGDVNGLYLQYKTFDNIHDNLVTRQLGSALNEVFGTYDPLQAVGSTDDKPQVNTKELQEKVKAILQGDLGNAIHITSVTIPLVHFDSETETRLKAFQQAKADTRIAEQNKATAQAQADAAKLLADQPGIGQEGVQYQNCLNLTKLLAERDQLKNLPPTWNCGGSQAGTLIQTR